MTVASTVFVAVFCWILASIASIRLAQSSTRDQLEVGTTALVITIAILVSVIAGAQQSILELNSAVGFVLHTGLGL